MTIGFYKITFSVYDVRKSLFINNCQIPGKKPPLQKFFLSRLMIIIVTWGYAVTRGYDFTESHLTCTALAIFDSLTTDKSFLQVSLCRSTQVLCLYNSGGRYDNRAAASVWPYITYTFAKGMRID